MVTCQSVHWTTCREIHTVRIVHAMYNMDASQIDVPTQFNPVPILSVYRGVKYCHWIRWFYQTSVLTPNRRQPGRVDGPKASQHSIITYKVHFCINQDKTHQDGRFSFGLSSDATKYCIGKSCKLKHYRLLLGVFWQAKYAYIPWHYMVMWRLCKRRSIVLLSKSDKIDTLLLSDTTSTSGDLGCHWPVMWNMI